jgi:nucleoside-diphosphate-sugar epimerase
MGEGSEKPSEGARRRALVTGASGFVGSHLVDCLLRRGYEVTCLLRSTSSRQWLDGSPVHVVEGELLGDPAGLRRVVSRQAVVFHVAGAVRALDYAGFLRVNADATEQLLRACSEAGEPPGRFVLVSSVAASGPGSGGEPVTERSVERPVSEYGRSKLEAERRALAFADAVELVIVRPGAIYGPRDRETLPLLRLARHGILPAFAGREQVHNLCHVEDIAEGIALAGEARVDSGDVFLLGAAEEHTMDELARALCRRFDRTARLLPMPRALLYPVACVSEAWARLVRRPAMINRQKVQELVASWRLDISAARERLGYEPRWSLERGLADTVEWYRKHGLV